MKKTKRTNILGAKRNQNLKKMKNLEISKAQILNLNINI